MAIVVFDVVKEAWDFNGFWFDSVVEVARIVRSAMKRARDVIVVGDFPVYVFGIRFADLEVE